MNHKLLATLLSLFVAGCATTPRELVAELKPPKLPAVPITLPTTACTFVPTPLGDIEKCVLGGVFRLEKENAHGLFYLGDLPSVYTRLGDGSVTLAPGGIWIPRISTELPRPYTYPGQGVIRGKSLADLEQARVANNPSATPTNLTSVAPELAIQNASSLGSPVQAGVAAGIATAVVLALADGGELEPIFSREPKTEAFVATIRQYFINRAPQ